MSFFVPSGAGRPHPRPWLRRAAGAPAGRAVWRRGAPCAPEGV